MLRGFQLAAPLLEILRHKLPVQQVVDDRHDGVLSAVLIVEVVGMLPDIEREKRCRTRGTRVLVGVAMTLRAPPSATSHAQPLPNCPAAASPPFERVLFQ